MLKNIFSVIGVMSGTSLDGIDLAYISFAYNKQWQFKIDKAETIAYSKRWQNALSQLVTYSKDKLQLIDEDYTLLLAKTINKFIIKHNVLKLDAVCSHGHTALHKPENGITYQIGNLPKLANLINNTIVCDFRIQDVKLGGQGAPLVPIGDALLFNNYSYCLNLGGFANISYLKNHKRIAFDICPVNIVLNNYANKLGFDFDEFGQLAKQGNVSNQLLTQLNNLKYYAKQPPKSLGLEWVKTTINPILNNFNLNPKDTLATFTEHIAMQLAHQFTQNKTVLITGGGAYNTYLIERLKRYSKAVFIIPDKHLIEYKEALIFGFLGVLKLRNEVNCLASVTGAKKDHSTGKIYIPKTINNSV